MKKLADAQVKNNIVERMKQMIEVAGLCLMA